MITQISVRDRSIAFLISAFLLACYLITYTGVIQSSDGLAMFATTESIARRGEIDANQLLWMDLQQGSYGPDGELYSRKGLGMPLLALPLVWLAKMWSRIGLVQTALLLNPILTAWIGALIFRMGRRFEWSRAASILTALAYGLATLAWPYSQTFFSDPVSAWGLFAAFYCMVAFSQNQSKSYLFLAGLAWGIAYLSRTVNLLTLPIYLVILPLIVRDFALSDLRKRLKRYWRELASFLIPVTVAGLLSLWWNWARYGSIWETGYLDVESFSGDWWAGIYGLLLGPARGLIWYSPILLLGLLGLRWFWHYQRVLLISALAIVSIYILTYAKWFMWHGGFSWGPRFMIPTLPFLVLLIGPTIEWITARHPDRAPLRSVGFILVSLLALLSIGVQWLGMLAPFGLVQNWLAENVPPLFSPETFAQIRYSPLILQWQYIAAEHVPFAWWNQGSIRWFGLLMPLAGFLAGLVVLIRQMRAVEADQLETQTAGDTSRNWLYAIALVLIMLAILTYYYPSLEHDEARQLAAQIERFEEPNDVILDLRLNKTQSFANVYHGNLPLFGLFPKPELDSTDSMWLDRLQNNYGRLWLLPDGELPQSSGWERPLRMDNFLVWEGRLGADDGENELQRLTLYALSASQKLINNGLGTIFGAIGESQSRITAENGQIRLSQYAISPNIRTSDEMLLELRWESLQTVEQNYHVFVHIIDEAGNRITQRDGQPAQWMRPTSTWQPGDVIIDRYGLLLNSDFTPGSYTINIGLYDPQTGQRVPVNAGTGEYEIQVGPIHVLAN